MRPVAGQIELRRLECLVERFTATLKVAPCQGWQRKAHSSPMITPVHK